MRTEPLFISAIIACPERAESGNTDVRGERHSYFLSTAESTETIPTATAPRITTEPEVLLRMLFIGYLYGIRSEIRLLKEIGVNVPKEKEQTE